MANSLSHVEQLSKETFIDGLAQETELFKRCSKTLSAPGGNYILAATNAGGAATEVTGSSTSVSAADMTSGSSSITQRAFVHKHTVPWAQLNWSMNLAADAGAQVANAAAASMNALFFDNLASLFSTDHPMAGAGVGQVGVGAKYIQPAIGGGLGGLAYLQTEAGSGVQPNGITAALSEASLESMRQVLRSWRNQRGILQNLGGAGSELALVVSPKNERTAKELITSALSGADNAVNTFANYADVVVWPGFTDDDDYFLIDKKISPVGLWVGETPVMSVTESDDRLFVNFVCRYQASFYMKPYAAGIVGSNVP